MSHPERGGELLQIYTDMELPGYPLQFKQYQEWKDKKKCKQQDASIQPDQNRMAAGNIPQILQRWGILLKEREALLAEILCQAAFTIMDSKRIVDLLVRQVEYFSSRCHKKQLTSNTSRVSLSSKLWGWDLAVFGQIIAPVIASNYDFTILVQEQDIFLDFYLAVVESLFEAGFMDNVDDCVKIVPRTTHQERDYFCPMIIYEESDIDSAVECIIHAAWDYSGMVSWSVTHVLIEEPVFRQVVDKLIHKLKSLKHGSRFTQGTQLYETQGFEDARDFAQLEVYPPEDKKCPHRLFIGWDPWLTTDKATRSKHRGCGISLLAFRTSQEAIELANAHPIVAASVWTEKMNQVNFIRHNLKAPTVWINCYGLIDPTVPVLMGFDLPYPLNGELLLQQLSGGCENVSYRIPSTRSSSGEDNGEELMKVVSAHKNWKVLSPDQKLEFIAPAFLSFQCQLPNCREKLSFYLGVEGLSSHCKHANSPTLKKIGKFEVRFSKRVTPIVRIIIGSFGGWGIEDVAILMGLVLWQGSAIMVYCSEENDKCKQVADLCNVLNKHLPNTDLVTFNVLSKTSKMELILDNCTTCEIHMSEPWILERAIQSLALDWAVVWTPD